MTKTTETMSISVESAMMFGLMPCLTAPKIAVGRVSTPAPLTKLVMMKSSREMMKASRNPERMPGAMSGRSMPEGLRPARVEVPRGLFVHAPRARLDLGRGPLQPPHPERDVLGDRHVGEERVLLEDGVHRPPVGRQPLDLLAVEEDRAFGHVLEPRDVYSVVKDSDAHVRFTFLTGVSKFSRVSLFSGLDNLTDITLDPRYSALCGYTDADLDTVFAPELPGLDRDEIRRWYNGYGWLGEGRVYNPFDILLLFDTREFAAHWFRTGTPTFLVETLVRRGVSPLALERMAGTDELLSTFDVDDMATEALLFQTGYLTIRDHRRLGGRTVYRLGYPNQEVRQSLNETACRATWPGIRRARWPTASVFTNCSKPTTSRG